MPAPARYYAEYTQPVGCTERGWHLFDRMRSYGAGDPMPVAKFWRRADAFLMRDMLNEREADLQV